MIQYITTNGIGNPWVAAELKGLSDAGIPFRLHSMRDPGSHFFRSGWARRLNVQTNVIYPLPIAGFALSIALAPLLFHARFLLCLVSALFGKRESLRARFASFAHTFVAAHWARSLRHERVALIHSQWIHSGGTIGMYGARMLGVPFSFTGHAVDLFRDRVALEEKIRRAAFIVCISDFHRRFYLEHGARPEQLITVHCGIELGGFEFRERLRVPFSPHIISLGRLVEKKGFKYLIDACAILRDRGIDLRCTIAGDGPLTRSLQQRVRDRRMAETVCVTGKPVAQEDLHEFLQSGDIFAQPCVWSSDNDVDGTPRTLMEAMACGLPSISTWLAGIPDIIEHGESGLLVPPNSEEELADAIERLIASPDLVTRISRGGRERIEREFALPDCLAPLFNKFAEVMDVEGLPAKDVHSRHSSEPVTTEHHVVA